MQACCFYLIVSARPAPYGVGEGEKALEKGVKNKGAESFSEAAKTKLLQSTLSKLKGNAEHTTHSGVVCLKSQTALINVFIFIANSMNNLLFFPPRHSSFFLSFFKVIANPMSSFDRVLLTTLFTHWVMPVQRQCTAILCFWFKAQVQLSSVIQIVLLVSDTIMQLL